MPGSRSSAGVVMGKYDQDSNFTGLQLHRDRLSEYIRGGVIVNERRSDTAMRLGSLPLSFPPAASIGTDHRGRVRRCSQNHRRSTLLT